MYQRESLANVLMNEKIDFVFHLAAFWNFKPGYLEAYEKINVQGTKNMLDFADNHHAKRFIFTSSISALTLKPNEILTEQTRPDPGSSHPYGFSKALSELDIEGIFQNQKERKTAATIVRLSGVFDK